MKEYISAEVLMVCTGCGGESLTSGPSPLETFDHDRLMVRASWYHPALCNFSDYTQFHLSPNPLKIQISIHWRGVSQILAERPQKDES